MITWKRSDIGIADYNSIPSIIVEEVPRKRKQGLWGYHVECFRWHGKMKYQVCIQACWLIDCDRSFDTLRDAWEYIEKYTTTKGA